MKPALVHTLAASDLISKQRNNAIIGGNMLKDEEFVIVQL
jgi:hypothetical protein